MQLDELRPVLAFSYVLDARVWGATNSAGYHLTNVLLHALNALLVFAIARSVAPADRWIGLIAGALFAIMPCHAEPISWISGRVDSLAALFYLGSFLCFVQFRSRHLYVFYAGALILFFIGLFAKQSVVTLPVLMLAYDFVSGRISRFTPHLPFFGALVFYLALRRALFGNALREDSLYPGMLTDFAYKQVFYVTRLLPFSAAESRSVKVAAGLVLLPLLVLSIRWLFSHRSRYAHVFRLLLFFGPVWYAITVSPMIVTYTSARHLYITAAGLCIAAALLISPEASEGMLRRGAVFGCLVLLYGAAITRSIQPWIDNGLYMDRISSQLPAAMRSIPPGSTVFMALPAMRHKRYFLDFALPFLPCKPRSWEKTYMVNFRWSNSARPIAARQRNGGLEVRPVLLSLTDTRPIYVVTAGVETEALVVVQRTISATALKERIKKVLSRPLDSPFEISWNDADRVSQVLFQGLEARP